MPEVVIRYLGDMAVEYRHLLHADTLGYLDMCLDLGADLGRTS